MHRTRLSVAVAIAVAGATALAGCGSGSSTASSGGTGAAPGGGAATAGSGSGKTITVWAMNGDLSPQTLKAINAEFTKQTGAKVNVQTQQWNNIGTKITTALGTSSPPDVIDMGNTQVAGYAANGGLMDLTSHKSELEQGQTWLQGLVQPATVDGKLYAVPSFGGVRAVIYNKPIWKKAGITKPPTTFGEFTADLRKIKAQHPGNDFSALYLPGQYWYVGMQFVWDAGGQIATDSGGTWTSGFSSPQAQKGLAAFKKFQNEFSSPASRTLNTDKPADDTVFAGGKAAAFIEPNAILATVKKDNPKLTDADLGTFPFPGISGKNQPVMLGGSDWGIAAKSKNQQLALTWTKIAASPKIQNTWVFGHDGWIPNSEEASKAAAKKAKPLDKAFFTAALRSNATPANPNWATIENTQAINKLFSSIASGSASPKEAAATFDANANKVLNGNS